MSDSGIVCLKEVQTVKDLDNLLKCGICYEYFSTTLITPCSHNYCSLCIRQSLLYRNQCPSCFEETSESQLRPNRLVDNILIIFIKIKDKLSKYYTELPIIPRNVTNVVVKHETAESHNSDCMEDECIPSSSKGTDSSIVLKSCQKTPIKEKPSTSKKEPHIPAMFSPKKPNISKANEVRVPCPVCSVEIPERSINIHLDACLKRSQENSVQHQEKRNPLPKLVYNLLHDKDLRKRLSEIGLSTIGDRKTLINRHKRYTLLYNSERDSLNPRPVTDIIKQLKKEEDDEKKVSTQSVKKLNVDRKADPRANEEAQRQYLQEHRSSFQKLIGLARRNRHVKKNNESLDTTTEEPKVISLDEHSNTSDSDFEIKRRFLKRKIINSDSDGDSDGDHDHPEEKQNVIATQIVDDILPQKSPTKMNLDSCSNSNKGNDSAVQSKANIENNKISPDVYDDSTDEMSSSEYDSISNRIFEEVASKNQRLKELENLKSPKKKICSNLPLPATSPVFSSKLKINRTPRNMIIDSEKRIQDVSPDLLLNETSSPSSLRDKSLAGQGLENNVVDSDSSSNHSASLLMYTGPDCDIEPDLGTPTQTPVKSSSIKSGKSEAQINNFDLGIIDLLTSSEEFVPRPIRRQSRRIRSASKHTSESKSKVLQKRVRIDDL